MTTEATSRLSFAGGHVTVTPGPITINVTTTELGYDENLIATARLSVAEARRLVAGLLSAIGEATK